MRAITFNDSVTLGANAQISAGSGNVAFNDTLNGTRDLGITTTGNVTFSGATGDNAALRDLTLTGPAAVTTDTLRARRYTQTGGSGATAFGGGGLIATGDVSIESAGGISGSISGNNGVLDAGAGAINLTSTFMTLDITGASATLLPGSIGGFGAPSQQMANLISINGQRNPWPGGIPSPNFTFAGFEIGTEEADLGGGGTSHPDPEPSGPSEPPVVSPPPSPNPPVAGGPTPSPETPELTANTSISRIERSGQAMTYAPQAARHGMNRPESVSLDITYSDALLEQLGCSDDSQDESCDALR